MAITHKTKTAVIGSVQWNETHDVDVAALRTALNVANGATANASDAHLLARANHTGTQAASTITGLATVATTGAYADLSGSPSIPTALTHLDTTVTGAQLNADHAKLSLIEAGATADQSAAEVPVTLTATNYSAATPNVEAHLTGINTALGSLGGGHDAVTVTDSSSIDFTLTGQALTAVVLPAGVNHDALAGFVANEHIDWTTDQGETNLHEGNIPDLSATYSTSDHDHSGVYEPADASILKSEAIGTTIQGYDADTAKLDVAQSWTATQSFTTITGTAVTVSAPGTAQSVALDGRCHVIELASGVNTEITGLPQPGYSNCLVRIKQPAVGSGTISWGLGHRFMGGSELNTASDSFSDFMLDSHDGSTVLCRGVGVEP